MLPENLVFGGLPHYSFLVLGVGNWQDMVRVLTNDSKDENNFPLLTCVDHIQIF